MAIFSQVYVQGVATNTMILSIKGATIAIDGYVNAKDIGEGDINALHCHTNKPDCCDQPPNQNGEWFFPNGNKVKVEEIADDDGQDYYYRSRGLSVILLNRANNPPEKGRFRCEVVNALDELQITYINISMLIEVG